MKVERSRDRPASEVFTPEPSSAELAMIVRLDPKGQWLSVSPACETLLGFTPDEMIGTRTRNSLHPDDIPQLDAMIARLEVGGRDQDTINHRLRHKNGQWVWVEARWRVVRDDNGRIAEFAVSAREIGARLQAEKRLQTSEALYRALADSLPQMVWIVRAEDRTAIYGNRQYHTYYGAIGPTRDERIARNHPDDVETMEETWAKAAREAKIFIVEGRLRRVDGQYRWHKVIATPIFRDGRVVEWLGTALDIDEMVAARQTLRETSDLLGLSQEAAGAGFFDINLITGSVILSRESAEMHELDGDGPQTIDLATWQTRVDPDDGVRVLKVVEEACLARQTYSAEFRVPLPNGGVRWIHGIGRAHYDASGRAVRMIGLNFDVTARKMTEAKLIEATEAAEAARRDAELASAAKSDFLASMSHEIRTPLNSIIGYTDLLLEGRRDILSHRRWLELIQESGSALLTVVNDILDFSKIEAGQITLEHAPFRIDLLIQNVLSMVDGLASKTDLIIERVLPKDLPAFVVGDSNRLRQILLNLLNNAVKFTSAGKVTLAVSREDAAPGRCRLLFEVTDTGIGIPPERQSVLFQRFSQGDGSITRRFGGTGLGLAISKSLVELMGGMIGVESRQGRGSRFWFRIELPIAEAVDDTESRPHSAEVVPAVRILLVEDVEINRDLARLVLESGGHQVDTASDGLEAIRKVQSSDFALVLMDVQMPIMDGITATRHIRALDHPCRMVPIVAMTANVLPQQIAAFKAAGMNDHVGKPFKRKELFDAIALWTRKRTEAKDVRSFAFNGDILADFRTMVGDKTFMRLIDKFKHELDTRFGALREPPDRAALAKDTHAMISVSGSFGFIGLSDLCREVETACRRGDDLSLGIVLLRDARKAVLMELASLT